PLPVALLRLGIRTDGAVEGARLELVGIGRQGLGVGHAEVAGADGEVAAERQRAQRRVAARAPTPDRQPAAVDQSLRRQVAGSVDAVVDVDDAPLPVEPLAVL